METLLHHRASALVLILVLILGATTARADDDGDHELARRLVESGEIRALPAIVEQVAITVPGKVLEVEFESEKGVYKYELKILRPDGKVQEVEVDARDGQVLKIEDDEDDD